MELIIKKLTGACFSINVSHSSDVKTMKNEIYKVGKIPKTRIMKAIYLGKILNDNSLLSEYNIKNKSNIIIVVTRKKNKKIKNEYQPHNVNVNVNVNINDKP